MPLFRLLMIAIALALMAAFAWWWQNSRPDVASETATAGVIMMPEQNRARAPLHPSVVTAASKLGQGRRAVAGMPTVADFRLPTLRDTPAGVALLIPHTPLPSTAAHQFSSPAATIPGDALSVRFDIYSWSEGVLVATARTAVELTSERNLLDVPDALEELRSDFGSNTRLLLVIPVGSQGLPAGLNPHDAYVLIAQRERTR